ncbi:hypothetical protein RW03080701_198 [Synechococcus phage S-RIM8]|uniref:Uncharacterized protein n=1 Tax=Synechococcus phage S-RIM8 TaxID=756278 RepID=A0A1D7S9M0_9CAUD|nr:hypothetical protein HOQ82_gp044 [Synechococcus phage S-RIM8]AFB15461.1 hypothetical protein SWSG_00103 [Synechococcus phage S-RIM8 A.HR5]AOO10348.1 hypothetical protein RW01021201_200 [Synechococcus phage S-RIM8]AOO10567.1 hypothetical protein RW03080701_198 [Synechococcus phage S-RIM8]AOO10788.1 hypothetical protein RW060613_200 [Synechococcus phage S-RIM8]AOO11010.1 hypothetical protein RW080711_201 [Synechococcus phage S-RIM8]
MFNFYDESDYSIEEMYLDQLIDQMHTFAEQGREKDAVEVYEQYLATSSMGQ